VNNSLVDVLEQEQRNVQFWRGLVMEIGHLVGTVDRSVYTADDGTVVPDPLALNIVPAVKRLVRQKQIFGVVRNPYTDLF
jgi:hypothetical protein